MQDVKINIGPGVEPSKIEMPICNSGLPEEICGKLQYRLRDRADRELDKSVFKKVDSTGIEV